MVDKKNLRFSYDQDADVLYMSIGMPRECCGEIDENGIIIKTDAQNPKMVVGLTILDFQQRFSNPHAQALPINMTASLQPA